MLIRCESFDPTKLYGMNYYTRTKGVDELASAQLDSLSCETRLRFHILGVSRAAASSDKPQAYGGDSQHSRDDGKTESDKSNRIIRYPLPKGFVPFALTIAGIASGLTLLVMLSISWWRGWL
jgi:hypothetical protein